MTFKLGLDQGTISAPFGISLFLAEWDEPFLPSVDSRQSEHFEPPRTNGLSPLPPQDRFRPDVRLYW